MKKKRADHQNGGCPFALPGEKKNSTANGVELYKSGF